MRKILILFVIVMACSCSKLPLQRSIKYEPHALDPHQGMTCWEYICNDLSLSSMKNAIELCGLEDYYKSSEEKYTFLLLDDTAFSSYILPQFSAGDIADIPIAFLKNILLFHIIRGEYSSYNGMITYDPIHVITLWNDVNAIMTIKLNDAVSLSQRLQDKVTLMDQCGNSSVIRATSSDLIMTNGPAHILSRHCVYIK